MNTAITELKTLYLEDHRLRFPSLPEPARVAPTYTDKTANGLTKCITAYLKLRGAFVSRLNNGGVFDKRLNRYRPGTNRKGLPDILATYQGNSLMIEVKAGKDRLSEHQERIRGEQEQSGGIYYTARNFADFKTWFDNIN